MSGAHNGVGAAVRLAVASAWWYLGCRRDADDPPQDEDAAPVEAPELRRARRLLRGLDTVAAVRLLASDPTVREIARQALLERGLPSLGYEVVAFGPRWRLEPRTSCADESEARS